LSSQGQHDASTTPASAAAWMIAARSLWWVEKPMNWACPTWDRVGGLAELPALEQVGGLVDGVVVAQPVQKNSRCGRPQPQPGVDAGDHCEVF